MYLFQCISIRFIITLLIKSCLILQIIQRLSPQLPRLLCQLLHLRSRQHLLLLCPQPLRHRYPRMGYGSVIFLVDEVFDLVRF